MLVRTARARGDGLDQEECLLSYVACLGHPGFGSTVLANGKSEYPGTGLVSKAVYIHREMYSLLHVGFAEVSVCHNDINRLPKKSVEARVSKGAPSVDALLQCLFLLSD